MFFGRRYFVYFFCFQVGLVLNKTLRLGCLNGSSCNQKQISSELHFQVQIPFFPTYPSVVPNSNVHLFFLVNGQLDASSCYVDFNCHFSSTVPRTSFRVYYFVKFNCGSSDFQESLSLALQACLPIIDDLSRSAMRPRHWKQLLRVTGGAVHISNEGLTRMTLGQLLELGLHGKLSPPLLHNSINAVSFASSK